MLPTAPPAVIRMLTAHMLRQVAAIALTLPLALPLPNARQLSPCYEARVPISQTPEKKP